MNTLFEVLALVWSVLCLILFFKIWGMTNDVKELKEYFLNRDKGSNEFVNISNVRDTHLEAPSIKSHGVNETPNITEGSIVYSKKDGKKMKVVKVLSNGKLRLDDGTDKPQYDEMSIDEISY